MNKMTWKIAAVATALFACSSGGHGFTEVDPATGGGIRRGRLLRRQQRWELGGGRELLQRLQR